MEDAAAQRLSKGPANWIRDERHAGGVKRLRAQLHRSGYGPHSHDTYTISLVEAGVQEFSYRGSVHRCHAGRVSILHPGERHDGRPGSGEALRYKCLYLDPAAVQDSLSSNGGPKAMLPFIRSPVLRDAALGHKVDAAFGNEFEDLCVDSLVEALANHLAALAFGHGAKPVRKHLDVGALDRAAEFLRHNADRVVHSSELERITGLSRFEMAGQFRCRFGTSPYRYLLMRRLELVRAALSSGANLADVAQRTGFADQSHMGRAFRAAHGMTPGEFSRLHRS